MVNIIDWLTGSISSRLSDRVDLIDRSSKQSTASAVCFALPLASRSILRCTYTMRKYSSRRCRHSLLDRPDSTLATACWLLIRLSFSKLLHRDKEAFTKYCRNAVGQLLLDSIEKSLSTALSTVPELAHLSRNARASLKVSTAFSILSAWSTRCLVKLCVLLGCCTRTSASSSRPASGSSILRWEIGRRTAFVAETECILYDRPSRSRIIIAQDSS